MLLVSPSDTAAVLQLISRPGRAGGGQARGRGAGQGGVKGHSVDLSLLCHLLKNMLKKTRAPVSLHKKEPTTEPTSKRSGGLRDKRGRSAIVEKI